MDVQAIVKAMTPEEKASLCAGANFWHTVAVERLGVPSVLMTDGPHGLRKQADTTDVTGMAPSVEAPCFPTAASTGSSFDRDLLKRLGETLAEECRAEGISILLGPGVNIKRSPLCGRNFEYFSEDPYLAGQMSAAYTQGLQGGGVGVSMKHFAVNNQETRRLTVSAKVSERALREIYLPAFENTVKEAKPWTIMASYNRLNGEYTHASHRLLEEILRDEWGFDGFVMTDWGACDLRVPALKAGDELQMPGGKSACTQDILDALADGSLDMEILDRAVARILRVVKLASETAPLPGYDRNAHHQIAREIARESMVLLQNDGTLPLRKEQSIAFIGPFAQTPRFQGGGSSHIRTEHAVGAWEAVQGICTPVFATGLGQDGLTADPALLAEAVKVAQAAEVAVIFAGLPDTLDSEGSDRWSIDLPQAQNDLISAIADTGVKTVVVLMNGSAVAMPWRGKVSAILESFLAGEAVGEAQVDLLFGEANPCAKLSETFPVKLQDTPAYGNFPGFRDDVEYGEGVYVGYRHYATREVPVLFPFGHGLSYTSYAYEDLRLDKPELKPDEALTLTFTIRNTGKVAGKEIVQVYIAPRDTMNRPVLELKQFAKVDLAAGQQKTVSLALDPRAFAWYREGEGWRVEGGEYEIWVGASSTDIRLKASVTMASGLEKGWRVTRNTTLGDLLQNPKTSAFAEQFLSGLPGMDNGEVFTKEQLVEMFSGMPLRSAVMFNGIVPDKDLDNMIAAMNSTLA